MKDWLGRGGIDAKEYDKDDCALKLLFSLSMQTLTTYSQ